MAQHDARPFLGEIPDDPASAAVAILPLPFERTTSYGKGTAGGPAAILAASEQVELYDEELDAEPYRRGILTLPAFAPASAETASALDEIEREAARHLEPGRFLASLGGEHSLTAPLVHAARERFGEIGVVQFDAHADLRESYEGSPHSHASVMRRVLEMGCPTVAVGLRALSSPEAELIRERRLPVVWGRELHAAERRWDDLLATLPEAVYLTFDLDYFDPSLVPATGTPEPGGGAWLPTLALLRRLFAHKKVVAMDLVELAPIPGQPASDFLAARLLYRCLGYHLVLGSGAWALELRCPSELYRPSLRRYPDRLPPVEYPGHYEVRRVQRKGEIRWQGRFLYVSQTLAGEAVGLEETDDGIWSLYLADTFLAKYDERARELV